MLSVVFSNGEESQEKKIAIQAVGFASHDKKLTGDELLRNSDMTS